MGVKEAREIERLMLTKDQIIEVLDAIIKVWKRNAKANAKLLLSMYALKAAIKIVPDSILEEIWFKVMTAFFELRQLNDAVRLTGEMPNAQFFVDRMVEKIRRGDLGS